MLSSLASAGSHACLALLAAATSSARQGEVPGLVTISGLVMSCLVLMTKCPLVDTQAGYMFR